MAAPRMCSDAEPEGGSGSQDPARAVVTVEINRQETMPPTGIAKEG